MKDTVVVCLWLATLLTAGISCSKTPESDQVITLSYSIFFPATHSQCEAAAAWTREIEANTGGRVKIDIFPGGTLTKADETYNAVVSGIADIGMSCFAYNRGRFPVMEAVDLPMGYPSGRVATLAANAFYQTMRPRELDEVQVLYLHAHGPGLLHTKKPVKSLDDLQGLKIRSTGLSAKVVSALGGVPVAMPQGATYEALQKGVVDGTFAPIETLKGWNQAEVVNSTVDCHQIGYTTGMYVVMNKAKWEALPEEVQKVFSEVSQRWIEVHAETWDSADLEGEEFTVNRGNQIFSISREEAARWTAAVTPVIDEYIQEAQGKGLPGEQAVAELRKLIREYRARVQ